MDGIKNIPKSLITIETPDHPFTFDGPDILISDNNGLLAVFKVRENESKNPNKIFSRVTNTLIAYPPYTKMVFLHGTHGEISDNLIQYSGSYFSESIELKDLRRAKALIRDKKDERKIKDIKQVQRKLFTIQSQVQNDNLAYISKSTFRAKEIKRMSALKNRASYWDRFSQKEITVKANIFEYENQFIGFKKLSKKNSDLEELRPFYEFVINSEFDVDNGVPFFKFLSRKALNVSDIPKIKYDPLKPTRVASLFGWHLVNSNDLSQIEGRISRYKK